MILQISKILLEKLLALPWVVVCLIAVIVVMGSSLDINTADCKNQSKKIIFICTRKLDFVVKRVIWGKYNIGFGISIKFPSQRKKIFKSVHKQGNWTLVVQRVIWGKYNIGFGIPSNFQLREKKNYSNRSINKEIGLLRFRESLGESTMLDLESPSNCQVKERKKYFNRSKQRNNA